MHYGNTVWQNWFFPMPWFSTKYLQCYMWCDPAKGTQSWKTKFPKRGVLSEWYQNDQNHVSARSHWKRHIVTIYWSIRAK